MADARRSTHLAVLIGASAGAYAVSLAAVTAFQSATDQAAIEDRRPLGAAATSLSRGHDALDGDLARAARAYGDAAARYDELAPRLDELESGLAALTGKVSAVSGAARSLPGHVALPTVTRTVSSRPAPVVHATTGASGKRP